MIVGPALVAEPLARLLQLVDDDLNQQLLARENRAQPLDGFHQLGQFVGDLLALEPGQALELHVEDGLGLDHAEAELRHQAFAGFRWVPRTANQLDDGVEMIEGDLQPLEDVCPRLGATQLELDAAPDHFAAELDELLDDLQQRQDLRPATDDGQHDDAERRLQRRLLVEVVENDLRNLAAFELDDDPHPVAVGLVAKIGNPLDGLLTRELGDLLDEPRLVDLIGDLGDDDGKFVALLALLDASLGAKRDGASPGLVGVEDPLAADDETAGREIWARNRLHHRAEPGFLRVVPVLDDGEDAVEDLAHVVRRDVGRHTDRDAG